MPPSSLNLRPKSFAGGERGGIRRRAIALPGAHRYGGLAEPEAFTDGHAVGWFLVVEALVVTRRAAHGEAAGRYPYVPLAIFRVGSHADCGWLKRRFGACYGWLDRCFGRCHWGSRGRGFWSEFLECVNQFGVGAGFTQLFFDCRAYVEIDSSFGGDFGDAGGRNIVLKQVDQVGFGKRLVVLARDRRHHEHGQNCD